MKRNEEMNLQNTENELENCKFVKTILMITIVFYHSILFWNNWFTKDPVYSSSLFVGLSFWLNSFHIYTFVLVSGYLFYFLKMELGKYREFRSFAITKIKRLIVPYIFLSVFWCAPIYSYFFDSSIDELFQKYILGISPNQLWFILMLFWVFIIFYFCSEFFMNFTIRGAVLVLFIYGLGIIGGGILTNYFQIWTACLYVPLFWIGFKLRQYNMGYIRKIPLAALIVTDIVLFIFVQYIQSFEGVLFTILNLGISFALHIVGSVMVFVFLQKLSNMVKWKENKFFDFISKQSMSIYLIHQQIIYFLIYWLNGGKR